MAKESGSLTLTPCSRIWASNRVVARSIQTFQTRCQEDGEARKEYGQTPQNRYAAFIRRKGSGRARRSSLKGEWKHYRDLHIEPDWILIYRVEGPELSLARTGTHSDVFNE
jgi:mRNA interferase YafQ